DGDALLAWACRHDAVVRMERGVGKFIVEGTLMFSVTLPDGAEEGCLDDLNNCYVIARQPTTEQDVGFGIRQLVDIALKALSPSINDSTTAATCVDYLTAILVRLATRRFPSS